MDTNEDEASLDQRVTDLEINFKALFNSISRRNQELLGYLLVLSLPMSDKRRLETTTSILKTTKLEPVVLKEILLRYFKEGIKSDLKFDDLIEPLINIIGFEELWKTITTEMIRELFGEVGVVKWIGYEKYYPCKNEVNL